MNTTSTFYATYDGTTYYQNATSWDVGHDAAAGNSLLTTQLSAQTGCDNDPQYRIKRGMVTFDTSAIGLDTITSATLSIYCDNVIDLDNDGDDWITVVEGLPADKNSFVNADYAKVGDAVDNPTEGIDSGERLDLSGVTINSYYDWDLNSTGIGWIDPDGDTCLGIREGHDVLDIPTTFDRKIDNLFAGQVTEDSANDAMLVIEHEAGASSSDVKSINGVTQANVKSMNGVTNANIKSVNGISNV